MKKLLKIITAIAFIATFLSCDFTLTVEPSTYDIITVTNNTNETISNAFLIPNSEYVDYSTYESAFAYYSDIYDDKLGLEGLVNGTSFLIDISGEIESNFTLISFGDENWYETSINSLDNAFSIHP